MEQHPQLSAARTVANGRGVGADDDGPCSPTSRTDTTTFLIVFLLLLFVLPARRVLPGLGAEGRPANVIGIAIAGAWVLAHLSPRLTPRGRQPLRTALFILWVVVLCSYVAGVGRGLLPIEQRAADRMLLVGLGTTGIILGVADGISTRQRLDRLLSWMTYGAGFMGFVGLLQFMFQYDLVPKLTFPPLVLNAELISVRDRGGTLRVPGTAGHSIEFGVVGAMALPIAVHYALGAETRNQRLGRWIVVLLIASSIPLSGSRAAFVGLAGALVLLGAYWSWKMRAREAIAVVAGLATVRASIPGLLGTMRYLFLNTSSDRSAQARTLDWPIAFRLIGERPWFGRGFGTYVPEVYRVLDNEVLGLVVAGGFVVAAGFTVLVATALLCVHRAIVSALDSETKHLAVCVEASLVIGLLTSLFFDSLSFPTFTGLMAFLIGTAGAVWRLAKEPKPWEGDGPDPYSWALRTPAPAAAR